MTVPSATVTALEPEALRDWVSQHEEKLVAAGLDGAYVLTGGVPGYAAVGGDVVRGRDRWALERQVRFAAGSLVMLGLLGGRFLLPHVRSFACVIGAGLTFSAATDTCAMGRVLSALRWNKTANGITPTAAITQFPHLSEKAA